MFSSLNHIDNYALRWLVLHIAFVGGLGSALSVVANSAAPKRGRCEEQLPCPKHHWSGAALPPTHQVYEQKKRLPQTSIEELKGIKNKN